MNRLEISRRLDADDIAMVEDLLVAATPADGRRPLSDHLHLDLLSGGSDGFVAVRSIGDTGRLDGYAQISPGNGASALEVVVRPSPRTADAPGDDSLVDELVTAAFGAVAADGGGTVNWWVFEPTDSDRRRAERAGMHVGRTLHQMRRPLPTGREVTVETRPFDPTRDELAWIEVNNRAFADHGEQGGWTLETLRQREAEDWFDPAGFLIHERDGRMAAFCWTKVHEPASGGESMGEIYVIAVDPDFHGLGLGTQLTLAGLEHLSDAGIPTALLYVDADNDAAVHVYERLGFTVAATNIAFVADVAPHPA